jgi:hypothetical protein
MLPFRIANFIRQLFPVIEFDESKTYFVFGKPGVLSLERLLALLGNSAS